MDCCLLDKLALARGQVPLNFDEGEFNVRRFATRAWACGERVRYPTIFPKSLIRYLMTGGGIVANRGRSQHPEDRLEGKSLGFSEKRRESCGGPESIDSSPMMAFEERHLGRDRFLYNSYQFGNSFS